MCNFCYVKDLDNSSKTLPQMLMDFKNHPAVKLLIKGGKMIEYSGHLVLEGGLGMMPKIAENGVLVMGDATGFYLNGGYAVRGIDLAIGLAEMAAKAVIAEKQNSEAALSLYKQLMDESFVMKDLNHFLNFPEFMEDTQPESLMNIRKWQPTSRKICFSSMESQVSH